MIPALDLSKIRQELEAEHDKLRQRMNAEAVQAQSNPDHDDLAQNYRSDARDSVVFAIESKYVKQIEEALEKLETGTYGLCEVCHQPIAHERLEILPHATMCMKCQAEES